ncbi:MAG: hypothetical protein U0360_00830 [Dehalococcoidia bacterium]
MALVPGLALVAAFTFGAAALPTAAYAQAGAINIELSEFSIKASATSAPAGTVNFSAKNGGANQHELVVVRSTAAPGSLALNANNGVDEAQITIVKRMDRVASGGTGSLSVDLSPGSYILLCNVGQHYSRGMNIAFTVPAAGGATGAAPAQAAPAAPKAGTGDAAPRQSSAPWVFGGLAVLSALVAIGSSRRPGGREE